MRTHRQTHRSFYNHTHSNSSPNPQQRGYNLRNAPSHPNYQPSRRPHNVHNNPHANYSSHVYFGRQFWDTFFNLRFDFRIVENYVSYLNDNDGYVLKYLKTKTHHAHAKDGIHPKVVIADVESDNCAICQSEYEHEENIGVLQCGHEYHTDCIKQWLLKKKDCPMCRALVLPSQEQRSLSRDIYSMARA